MRNSALYYGAIVIGIIALAVGIYYQVTGGHPARAIAGIIVGIILLVGGIVGFFVIRPRSIR